MPASIASSTTTTTSSTSTTSSASICSSSASSSYHSARPVPANEHHALLGVPEIVFAVIDRLWTLRDYISLTRTCAKLRHFLSSSIAFRLFHLEKAYLRCGRTALKYLAFERPNKPLWLHLDLVMLQIKELQQKNKQQEIYLAPFANSRHLWPIALYIMDHVQGFRCSSLAGSGSMVVFGGDVRWMTADQIRLLVDRGFGDPAWGLRAAIRGEDLDKVAFFVNTYPQSINDAMVAATQAAVAKGDHRFLEIMCEAGGEVDAICLEQAVGKLPLLKFLLQHCARKGSPIDPQLLHPALSMACSRGASESVRLLLDMGADPSLDTSQEDWFSRAPLSAAIRYGHVDLVDVLLNHGGVELRPEDLEDAIRSHNPAVVQRMLEHGTPLWADALVALARARPPAEIVRMVVPKFRRSAFWSEAARRDALTALLFVDPAHVKVDFLRAFLDETGPLDPAMLPALMRVLEGEAGVANVSRELAACLREEVANILSAQAGMGFVKELDACCLGGKPEAGVGGAVAAGSASTSPRQNSLSGADQ
ncbi:hypothetical protein HDU96_007475 [Phlyctochytrium bullatum]|nr:hypothetical protein HDU96_007475 [Phlyctochytrium bullatum]